MNKNIILAFFILNPWTSQAAKPMTSVTTQHSSSLLGSAPAAPSVLNSSLPKSSPLEVKGRIEGLKKGRLHLVVRTSETRTDTLASSDFKKAQFTLRADISEPMVAQLIVDGYGGGFTFIAEPDATYEALLRNDEGAYIKGGTLHEAWQTFIREDALRRKEKGRLQARYEELRTQLKYRSASRVNDSLKEMNNRLTAETEEFLLQHDDIITAHTYQTHAAQNDASLQESRLLYDKMGDIAKASLSGRLMKERIQRIAKTAKGHPAPDFTLTSTTGEQVTMSAVKAPLKIVDFWASWCGPCRLNNPHLRGLYEQYHSKGLEVIGVSIDSDRTAWINAVQKDALPWINVSSLAGKDCEVARTYNVTAVPSVFVLNENNEIIATNLRGEALENFLKDFFEETK